MINYDKIATFYLEKDSGIEAEPVKLTKECPFDPSDVDYVASISFNYGLSLMDMNQVM